MRCRLQWALATTSALHHPGTAAAEEWTYRHQPSTKHYNVSNCGRRHNLHACPKACPTHARLAQLPASGAIRCASQRCHSASPTLNLRRQAMRRPPVLGLAALLGRGAAGGLVLLPVGLLAGGAAGVRKGKGGAIEAEGWMRSQLALTRRNALAQGRRAREGWHPERPHARVQLRCCPTHPPIHALATFSSAPAVLGSFAGAGAQLCSQFAAAAAVGASPGATVQAPDLARGPLPLVARRHALLQHRL